MTAVAVVESIVSTVQPIDSVSLAIVSGLKRGIWVSEQIVVGLKTIGGVIETIVSFVETTVSVIEMIVSVTQTVVSDAKSAKSHPINKCPCPETIVSVIETII